MIYLNILTIRNLIIDIFNAVIGWFTDIFSSIEGALSFLFAGFFVFTIVRLLIIPLVGNAGSDISRFSRGNRNSSRNSNNNKEIKES